MLSYTPNHLLALIFHQIFTKHPVLCGQVPLTYQGQSGTENHASPRDLLWNAFPLRLFTVLVTISPHFNMPVFNASVYFLMIPPPPPPRYWTVPSGKAKALELCSQLDIKDKHK